MGLATRAADSVFIRKTPIDCFAAGEPTLPERCPVVE
jgi:hypothetical protein